MLFFHLSFHIIKSTNKMESITQEQFDMMTRDEKVKFLRLLVIQGKTVAYSDAVVSTESRSKIQQIRGDATKGCSASKTNYKIKCDCGYEANTREIKLRIRLTNLHARFCDTMKEILKQGNGELPTKITTKNLNKPQEKMSVVRVMLE